MATTETLRGVFPEPKPIYKKNYIKENVKHIKRMQGLLPPENIEEERRPSKNDKYRNVPPKSVSHIVPQVTKSRQSVSQSQSFPVPKLQKLSKSTKSLVHKSKHEHNKRLKPKRVPDTERRPSDGKFLERGVQTERNGSVKKIYENGVIKYPSPSVIKDLDSKQRKKSIDNTDSPSDELSNRMGSLDMDDKEKDYIRGNILRCRQRSVKPELPLNPNQLPPTYQKGVVPKYLKNRKEEDFRDDMDPSCPPGHVLLPEDERKETLRVLRQSYADRIQELNSMPVRNDTLKMKKRKMEIEEELKKIDEGIKVFQRPKVFVKINA